MNQKPFHAQKQHNIGLLMSSIVILAVMRIRKFVKNKNIISDLSLANDNIGCPHTTYFGPLVSKQHNFIEDS